jgi:hypothetical protein
MDRLVVDVLGWVGALALLVAYGLVSARRLEADAVAYQLPNLVGSLLLIVNTAYYGAYPSAMLNLLWVGVAAHTLWRRWRARAPSRTV